MTTTLVTGASSFLGYHVVKRLNESGVRPRVLERPGSDLAVLDRLDVERCPGISAIGPRSEGHVLVPTPFCTSRSK